jgi:murein DD-endopeptidase MepM/ murein hydrolase activator NlpD
VSNGVISDIYDDYLYGTTVVIEHKDGIKSVYSNLSADLPTETVIGRTVITGEIIGGIGQTAVCEAAEAHHLHLEMIKDGEYVNPEEYF